MTATQRLRCFEPPTKKDYRAVRRFHYNHRPLMDAETDAIRMQSDLVALRPPKEPDWLEARIERCLAGTARFRWLTVCTQAECSAKYSKHVQRPFQTSVSHSRHNNENWDKQ